MPDANTLCHYTTAEAAFAHIIPSERLRLSPYSKMSDPLENRELAFGGGVWRDDEDAEEKYAPVVEMITRQRDLTRLLSFTVDATEGYDPGDVPFSTRGRERDCGSSTPRTMRGSASSSISRRSRLGYTTV